MQHDYECGTKETPWCDLHVHSRASDGDFRPAELVEMYAEAGCSAVALTDHDTVAGVEEFLEAARRRGIEGIPGVELSVGDDPARGFRDVHVVGLFVDHRDSGLLEFTAALIEAKSSWALRQYETLRRAGFDFDFEQVEKEAEGGTVVRRPHFWRVLSRVYPDLSDEEFFRNTSSGGPWYVPKARQPSLEEAVALVKRAGGVPVLAHPGYYGWPDNSFNVLEQALEAGIEAVETIYAYADGSRDFPPSLEREIVERLEEWADSRGLAVSGGTDFHGSVKPVGVGDRKVPYHWVERLRSRASRCGGKARS